MIILLILASIILVEGILITLSLIKINNEYLEHFYRNIPQKDKEALRFFILIPVFNEAIIIEETFHYFDELVKKYDNIQCIFITTEKENRVLGRNKTRELLQKLIVNNEKILLLHYPCVKGNKPSQLNYCLQIFKEQFCLKDKKTYICQYDADSRPDMGTFIEVADIILKTNARVIQQPTKYNKNYKQLGLYMKLESCFQSRWAFGFERRNQKLSINKRINEMFIPYAYCVGHGMIVESQLLYDMGMYPTPSEDVPFGLKMMLIKEPIYPTVLNDVGSVTENFKDLFYQSGNWIKAPLLAAKMYREVMKIQKISLHRSFLFFGRVSLDFFSWVQYLIFSILVIVNTYREQSIFILFIGYLVLFLDAAPGIYYTHKYIFRENNLKERLFLILICPLRSIVRGLSIISFVKQLKFGWYYDKGRNSKG